VQDLLTGFRVFSRRFAQEVHLLSNGFEIETELTIRAMAQDMAFAEVAVPYIERPVGSHSKLRTFRDGWKISLTILRYLRDFRPLLFHSSAAVFIFILASMAPPLLRSGLVQFSALLMALGFYFSSRLSLQRLRLSRRALSKTHDHHGVRRAS
jgi:hypothetical protein